MDSPKGRVGKGDRVHVDGGWNIAKVRGEGFKIGGKMKKNE